MNEPKEDSGHVTDWDYPVNLTEEAPDNDPRPFTSAFRTSPEIDKISPALAKACAKLEQAKKDAFNPHFGSKYADMGAVDSAIRSALGEEECFQLQTTRKDRALGHVVTTRTMHSSGQWVESDTILVEPKQQRRTDKHGNEYWIEPGSQDWGKALAYARRYGSMQSVALGVSNDPTDDDGETDRAAREEGNSPPHRGRQRPQQDDDTPRKMVSRFDGRKPCPICNGKITKGQDIAYKPVSKAAAHWDCYQGMLAGEDVHPTEEEAQTEPIADDDLPQFDDKDEKKPAAKKKTTAKKKRAAKKKTSSKKPVEPDPSNELDDDLPF
jgi:hypothetical protein